MINKDRVWGSAKYWIGIIGLAIIYHLGARLGLLMAHVQPNTSPVWPPTGIALAALLILGIQYWPGVALGVMLGFLVNNNPLDVSIGLTIAIPWKPWRAHTC
jgi:integral membrane sensor domain MASE1